MRKNKVRTTNLRVLVEVLAELVTIGQKRGIRHETFLLWKYHLPKKEKRGGRMKPFLVVCRFFLVFLVFFLFFFFFVDSGRRPLSGPSEVPFSCCCCCRASE